MRPIMTSRQLIHVALACGALVTQCTCEGACESDRTLPPPHDAGQDAGLDAGSRDAGTRDANVRDAGLDAGPGDGIWRVIPGVPPACEAAVAIDPTAVLAALAFEPCPDRTACRQLVVDWPARRDGWTFGVGSAYHDGTRGYFLLNHPDPEAPDSRMWRIVATDEGAVIALFRGRQGPRGCKMYAGAIGEGKIVIALVDTSSDTSPFWFVGADFAAPAASAHLVATVILPAVSGVQALRVGAEQIVYRADWASTLYRLGWDGTVRRIDDATGARIDGFPGDVLGHDFVFDRQGPGRTAVVISTDGAPPRVLVDPADPDSEAVIHNRTDGRTIAWLQGYRRVGGSWLTYERVDLYASDYAASAAEIRPVLLAPMASPNIQRSVLAGFGHTVVSDSSMMRFFRLADRHETVLAPPPGELWTGFVRYIGPREVMLVAGTLRPDIDRTIVLLDYTALEPTL